MTEQDARARRCRRPRRRRSPRPQRLRRIQLRRTRRRRRRDGELTSSDDSLTILIGSSGEAETAAVEEAVAAWSEESGVEATVQVANDLLQQLAQGFAAGTPPTCSTCRPSQIAGYAGNGSLPAYGDQLANKDDFYPSLVENFTIDDEFYCAPKDFSTLALIINTTCGRRRASPTPTSRPRGTSSTRSAQTLTTGRRRRARLRNGVPARRHLHGAGRRRARRRRRSRRRQPRERRSARVRAGPA